MLYDEEDLEDDCDLEKCPVCSTINLPGCGDTCKHFYGVVDGNEIIWSDNFYDFESEWGRFIEVCADIENEYGDESSSIISRVLNELLLPEIFAPGQNYYDTTAVEQLEKHVNFLGGESVETDNGMLSETRETVYLEDASNVLEIAKCYGNISTRLNQLLEFRGP